MLLKVSELENHNIEKLCLQGLATVETFFNVDRPYNKPKFVIVDDRATIDSAYGRKTEPWLVGWTGGKYIFLLNPENYEKESSHKYSQQEYSRIITHEIVHYFYKSLVGSDNPRWLSEGLSLYIAGQYNELRTKPKTFCDFLNYFDKTDSGVYIESGFVIKKLVDNFGKDKLLEFVKSLRGSVTAHDVSKKFNNSFGVELKYESINALAN